MNKISFKYFLRKDFINSAGESVIYLYVNTSGKVKMYSTGISIEFKYWDDKKKRARMGCNSYSLINTKLIKLDQVINDYLIKCEQNNTTVSHTFFTDLFSKKTISPDLVEWMELDLKNYSGKYAKETIHTYKAQLSKLREFNRSIRFEDITPQWWYRYEQFMTERGNNANTRHKCFTHLKTFINKAVESGVITANPLRAVKVKTGKGNRLFLSKSEFLQLLEFYNSTKSEKIRKVANCFLFSCATGLRFRDIFGLKWDNVKTDSIEIQYHKTKNFDTIYLNDIALRLLPSRKGKNDFVFKTISNQKANVYLKEFISAAGIDKKITFHCARHTFATLMLEASGNIAVVSKLLGHSNIATTQIYAKVLEDEKKKAVRLMDGF